IRFLLKEVADRREDKSVPFYNPADSDRLKQWVKGLKKTIGGAQKQKRVATKGIIRTLLNEIDGKRLIDIRNRALLAFGYAGAFRRSEIVSLNVDDIEHDSDGIYVLIRKSKTDQEGKGFRKYIYYG